MTNNISSTRFVRFAPLRSMPLRPLLFAIGAALTVLAQAAELHAQPLLAGQQPYRDSKTRADEMNYGTGAMENGLGSVGAANRNVSAAALRAAAAMRNRRAMLLLPLRTGENWKASPEFTASFVRKTDVALRRAMAGTNRFAVLEVRRFNPVLMRAVQDGVATTDDLNNLLVQPTTPNASIFLSKIAFTKAPLQSFSESAVIGSFVLESLTMTDNALEAKVTGRLYSADGQTTLRSLSATTTAPFSSASGNVVDVASQAANASVNRIISEFTRTSTEREVLMGQTATVATSPIAEPAAVPAGTSPTAMLPSDTLPGKPITGSSTRLPGTTSTTSPAVPAPAIVGFSTTTEVPPAETFPASVSNGSEASSSDATADAQSPATDASTSAATDAATSTDATVVDGSGTDSTSSGSDVATGGASGGATDAVPESSTGDAATSDATTGATDNSASGTANGTATDDAATNGVTSDGMGSEGTVGAMSTDSRAKRTPQADDYDPTLAFER